MGTPTISVCFGRSNMEVNGDSDGVRQSASINILAHSEPTVARDVPVISNLTSSVTEPFQITTHKRSYSIGTNTSKRRAAEEDQGSDLHDT